jgi:hypothetical protein
MRRRGQRWTNCSNIDYLLGHVSFSLPLISNLAVSSSEQLWQQSRQGNYLKSYTKFRTASCLSSFLFCYLFLVLCVQNLGHSQKIPGHYPERSMPALCDPARAASEG